MARKNKKSIDDTNYPLGISVVVGIIAFIVIWVYSFFIGGLVVGFILGLPIALVGGFICAYFVLLMIHSPFAWWYPPW